MRGRAAPPPTRGSDANTIDVYFTPCNYSEMSTIILSVPTSNHNPVQFLYLAAFKQTNLPMLTPMHRIP